MTLQEIQSKTSAEMWQIWKKHTKILSKCRFYGVRRSEWSHVHVKELNHLLQTGEALYKSEAGRKEKIYYFNCNGKKISHKDFIIQNPNFKLPAILMQFKRKGYFESKCKTIKLTHYETSTK